MPAYVVDRLTEELTLGGSALPGSRVLVLGVTYKRDVPDMRESPADDVVRLLRYSGATVSFHDPFVESWAVDGEPVPFVSLPVAAPVADACVLVTDHSAFADLHVVELAPLCLDTRGRLHGPGVVGL